MAKINNAQIIQKIVDELKLYPGKDLIPSELADKVLAVYQVNDQDVKVQTPKANIVRNTTFVGASAGVLYAVPATGKFFLTNVSISAGLVSASFNRTAYLSVFIDGVTQKILILHLDTGSGGAVDGSLQTLSYNLQNPILVDAGTNISAQGNSTIVIGSATMVGYTEE